MRNSLFLIACFLFIFCGSNKKIQFSKKYIPVYNPGGEYFFYDQKFSKSYELYQKRRDVLKEKTILGHNYVPKTDKPGKRVSQSDKLNTQFTDGNAFIDDSSAMVNSYGIDLVRLKGAKFIEVIDDDSDYENNYKEERPSLMALPQKIKAEFEEIAHDISSKMKNLHQKKIGDSDSEKIIVNFNNHNEIECGCSVSDYIHDENSDINDVEVVEEDESIKDEFMEEVKIDTE